MAKEMGQRGIETSGTAVFHANDMSKSGRYVKKNAERTKKWRDEEVEWKSRIFVERREDPKKGGIK